MSPSRHFQPPPDWPPAWANGWGVDEHGIFASFWFEGVEFSWRWIPPGEFTMGSPEDEKGRDDNEAQHRVTISRGFWLGTTPCTQAQWKAAGEGNPSHFAGDTLPVETVSWDDAAQFYETLNRKWPSLAARLPTEAEWEYACRAGTTTAFHDGSACTVPEGKDPALDRLGWHGEGPSGKTHPVGRKQPNPWGLHDMHGNVWEWCADWYGEYPVQAQTDPAGPAVGAKRALRGGGCGSVARLCRSACRRVAALHEDRGRPGSQFTPRGFRLAAGQPPESGDLAGGASRRG